MLVVHSVRGENRHYVNDSLWNETRTDRDRVLMAKISAKANGWLQCAVCFKGAHVCLLLYLWICVYHMSQTIYLFKPRSVGARRTANPGDQEKRSLSLSG